MNLNVPIKSVEQRDNEKVDQSIDEDRKILIQVNLNKIVYFFLSNSFIFRQLLFE